MIAIFLHTVIEGKQGHTPCRMHSLQQSLFLCLEFHGDHKSVTRLR